MSGVRFRQWVSYDTMQDSERGLAEALGVNPPRPSPIQALVMRPLLWIGSRTETKLTINDEGVTTDQGGTRRAWAWSDFAMSFETDDLIGLVIATTTAPVCLVKRSMTVDDVVEVRHLMAEHLRSTPESMARVRSARTGSAQPM